MTEVKFYVPDEKIPSVNAFRIIHGKSWGRRILDFIEKETASDTAAADDADTIYKKYFGDIAAEKSFIRIMDGDICSAEQALSNRLCSVRKAHPDKYTEIYRIVTAFFPLITKRMEESA
ncbi:MAG TPA: hypothetical protein O0X42_02100 [Methanocorpusculum sp.]|nr:hypothetical protein [Methanocorpusculum sp.]